MNIKLDYVVMYRIRVEIGERLRVGIDVNILVLLIGIYN